MNLTYIVFTKHLEGLDVPQLIDALQSIGVQGADLCVRDGYPVNPDNVATALPEAARRFADAGLCIPLVTAPGDFNRPDLDYAERYYAALGEAGVAHVKLGYWHWQPDVPYWTQLDEVRGFMQGFQALSEKYGVKTAIHNHSGASMGLNACAAMNIVRDCDPQYVGVFADPGHLSLCGEPIAMALDIVRSHLCLLALKDLVHQRPLSITQQGNPTTGVVRMGQGFVDWPSVIATLKRLDFAGPVSFHSEYGGEPVESVIDLARIDVRFFTVLCQKGEDHA